METEPNRKREIPKSQSKIVRNLKGRLVLLLPEKFTEIKR